MIEWHRWESWHGRKKYPERPDDGWSAYAGAWTLDVEPLRWRECNGVRGGDEHVGWKWSVTPKDLTSSVSYAGTVPGVDALDKAKHEATLALTRALAGG